MSADTAFVAGNAAVDPRAMRMLWALAMIALLPWLFILMPGHAAQQTPAGVVALFTVSHVGSTGFFWFDQRYRKHIAQRRWYFFGFPALISVVMVSAVAAGGPLAYSIALCIITVWQAYHFGKQNWGVLCLSSTATGSARPPTYIKHLYAVGSFGASAGILLPGRGYGEVFDLIWNVGRVVTIICAIGAFVDATRAAQSAHPLHTALGVSGALFFMPPFLFGQTVGVAIIGTIHGLHYYALTIPIAGDSKQGAPVRRLIILGWCGAALLAAFLLLTAAPWWGALTPTLSAVYLCLASWHFLADADLWRLSDPMQRRAIRESLPYLFR